MKIDGVSSLPIDPFRVTSTGVDSMAIAQASPDRDKEGIDPQKSLQNEKRSAEEIQKDLDAINDQLASMNRSIQFSIDENSKDIVVKIVDKDSGEIIRQIPPEGVLRLREHLMEMAGMIFKETV